MGARGCDAPGHPTELDTTHFKGNAPQSAAISAARVDPGLEPRAEDWFTLLPAIMLQPDTPHRFLIRDADRAAGTCGVETNTVESGIESAATHLRLDIYPDGGIARFRALGTLTPQAHAALVRRWKHTG